MARNVNVDPVRAVDVYAAWDRVDPGGRPVAMKGSDLLDGAAFVLLKSEFLAAQAGVVPWVPLPGGGQGVLTVGAALAQPESAWPQPELAHLYMLAQKQTSALHSSVHARRPGAVDLATLETGQAPSEAEQMARFFSHVGAGAVGMGAIPVAWVVIAAVGVLATVAASWYATRTKVEEIQTDAKLTRDMASIGKLTDLAQQQLATTGRIDPSLISAIKTTGSDTPIGTWPAVAVGAGLGLTVAAGGYYVWKRKRR